MPRPKKHPDYNPEKIMNELLETVSDLYNSHISIRKIGDELDLDWQKARKLLCTASYQGMVVYDSEIVDEVIDYYKQKKSVAEIMSLTGLSKSSVMSYLPYTKVPYNTIEVSANAERMPSNFTTRQQTPSFYDMNGSIYVYSVEALKHKNPEVFFNDKCDVIFMKDTGILDIDSEEDFELMQIIAEYLYKNNDDYQAIYQTAQNM